LLALPDPSKHLLLATSDSSYRMDYEILDEMTAAEQNSNKLKDNRNKDFKRL